MSNTPVRQPKSSPKALFSSIQYRPDPACELIRPINLGVAMEIASGSIWIVGLALRHSVNADLLEGLSQLSRELIEARAEVIHSEISAALDAARHPGDVLRVLARDNSWAFHVTVPKAVATNIKAKTSATDIEKAAKEYIFKAYAKEFPPVRIKKTAPENQRPSARRGHIIPTGVPAQTPPAWMTPPIFWRVPFAA